MDTKSRSERNLWVDYLRSAITVLVVAYHAALGYTTFSISEKNDYMNTKSPILDSQRWFGLDVFVNFNDIFFMFLMFFIGGLFIAKSIQKKGVLVFIKDRIYRLFLPFLLGGTLINIIAYFPTYYIATGNTNILFYLKDFFTIQRWPVGPAWFILMLFAFNVIVAVMFPVFKKLLEAAAKKITWFANKPVLFFLLVFVMTWILYVPAAGKFGAETWVHTGPFDFQISRLLAYSGYFVLGVVIGASDFNHQIFSSESPLIKNWKSWIILSLLIYTPIAINNKYHLLENLVINNKMPAIAAWMVYYSVYVASCTASCIAFISLFRSQIKKPKLWWNSLSENAYLIYLIHYLFIIWIQFSILKFNIPPFLKFLIAFITALILSWIASKLLRKIKFIKKYV